MLCRSSLPLSLLLVAMVSVGSRGVWAASLPRGSRVELTADRSAPPPPSTEMLRALHYIQSLSQRGPPTTPNNQQWEEEGEGQGEEGAEEQWLQAILETLQETQRQGGRLDTLKTRPQAPSPALTSVSRRRHRKYPLEEVELGQGGWGNSLKRTNENAQDEQYTPQKLATLQSVFEELQKISASKSRSENKRQSDYEEEGEEEEGDEDGEEEDAERRRKIPLEDWEPLDEDEEQEREEDENRGELSPEDDEDDDLREEDQYDDLLVKRSDSVGMQGGDDLGSLVNYYVLSVLQEQEQRNQRRRAVQEEEEEEGGRGAAAGASLSLLQLLRISEQLGLSSDQLLDLLKASSNPLSQQAPQRMPQPLSKPGRTPARLQAPPRTPYEFSKPARTPAHLQPPLQTPYELKLQTGPAPAADTHSRAHTHTGLHTHTQENLLSSPHARPLEAPEDAVATAEILHLLGLPALSPPQHPPVERQWQRPRTPPAPLDFPQDLLFSQRSTNLMDDPTGHDLAVVPDDNEDDSAPLERLLLEEEGPEERGLPPRSTGADEEDRLALRVLTRALEDYYLDQPDSKTGVAAGAMDTRSEPQEKTDRGDDNDQTLQRILGFFTPEQQDSSETARFS